MRRLLVLLVAAVLGLSLTALDVPPARALVPVVTGRLIDPSTDLPVPGVTVNLRLETPSGSVVSTTTSDAEGEFALSVGSSDPEDRFVVQVVAGPTLQGGYAKRYDGFVLVDWTQYSRWNAGDDIGDITGIPSYIKAKVVNARTRNAVSGVRVTLREAVTNDVVAVATTNSFGRFTISGFEGEDFNLKLQGSTVGYETGYRACNARVVPTIGEACGSPLGQIGWIYLDRL